MKRALILEGPGFSDQQDVVQNLVHRGFTVTTCTVGAEAGSLHLPDIDKFAFILLRGPWAASPEDQLLARILSDRLAGPFEKIRPQLLSGGKGPRVVGIGRGALLLFMLGFLAPVDFEKLGWREAFKDDGPWLATQLKGWDAKMMSLVSGRAVPEIELPPNSPLETWVEAAGESAGWRRGPNIFASLVDILAYAERSQLADFGYADLLQIQTQGEVLDVLARVEG